MKFWETLSVIFLSISWMASTFFDSKKFRWRIYFPFTAFSIVVLQVVFEGFLFQMILVYLISVMCLLLGIYKLHHKKEAKKRYIGGWKITGIVLFTIAVIIAIAIPALFPVSPSPTGSYHAATASFEWINESRLEYLTSEPDDYRDLMVKVWYPVDDNGDIAVSNDQNAYPVLIFSHGYGMSVDDYALEMEDIASHGYIIFGINHPYEASAVIYPDGRVIGMSQDVIASLKSEKQKTVNSLIEQYKNSNDTKTKQDLIIQIITLWWKITENSMNTWVADTVFVLDKAKELNNNSENFAGHLNLDEVGVFGHSFGGAVAGTVCLQDQRFKAGINMDGIQFDQYLYMDDSSIQTPFMEMTSDDIIPGINNFMYNRINNWVYRLHINGSKHNNFTDIPLFAPLLRQTKFISCGSINPLRMRKTVDSYILAFFDTYLKSKDSELLKDSDTGMPEIEFNVRGPDNLP